MHTPVLLQQAIEKLAIKKDGLYIDATYGEGGYTKEIIKKGGKVLAIDLDIEQIQKPKFPPKTAGKKNLNLIQGNFSEIETIAKENNFFPVDGVVFDLGLSMNQLENSRRGFSYKKLDDDLDMRLDLSQEMTVKELLGKLTVFDLAEILEKYSEEVNAEKIARAIKNSQKMEKVKDLVLAIDKALGKKDEKTYARVFQALRIAVNHEFENLEKGLTGTLKITKKGGRIVVVTFHSLEDRVVKKFVLKNHLKFVDKKPVFGVKSFERSAKLRTIII